MGFFKSLIRELLDEGNTVDIACNQSDSKVPQCYVDWGCKIYDLNCSRSPLSKGNITAIHQIKKIVTKEGYDIVHCHTPIAAACTRFACKGLRKKGVKVIYTTHGLHFYKDAPIKNWILYYPMEKICAHWTDVLITINKEDYERAQKKLKAKLIEYVPGVGLDICKFADVKVDRISKRKELGIPENAFLLLSVGELNTNKNHEIVIRALASINDKNIHYIIAGNGSLKDYLKQLVKELGLSEQVHLLGFRSDVLELFKSSDVNVFPSIREGLGMAALEGFACELPLICSDNRGTRSYANQNNSIICKYNSCSDFSKAIIKLEFDNKIRKSLGSSGYYMVETFSIENVNSLMKNIYHKMFKNWI